MPAHTTNKMILSIQYLWMILHNYFIIRKCSSRGPVVENYVKCQKIDPKLQKVVFLCFSECCHGNMCNLNVTVVLHFISRDLYLLFAILFSSKFQNSIFYQHMWPKSGLKFPRPFLLFAAFPKWPEVNVSNSYIQRLSICVSDIYKTVDFVFAHL